MTDAVDSPQSPGLAAGEEGERRRGLGLVLVTVVASVAVQGTVPPGAAQQIVVAALLGASLVLAFRIAQVDSRLMLLACVLAAAGLAVAALRAFNGPIGSGEARVMNAALVALGPPAVALGVLRTLQASGSVRVEAVMGVLALYMLIGMFFAFVYGAVDDLGGHPFFTGGAHATTATCLYYSFTTLSTVGYGDLTARSNLGHTLSIFEALAGQIYLVTVVSVIVSNLGRHAAPLRTGRMGRPR